MYELLREQLPDDWCVVWNEQTSAHQYDFLVLVPPSDQSGGGVVNLEVKGWFENYEANGAFVPKEGRPIYPQSQACEAIRSYADEISKFLRKTSWGIFGYAVVSPIYEIRLDYGTKPIYSGSACENGGMVGIVRQALATGRATLLRKLPHGARLPQLTQADADAIWAHWSASAEPVMRKTREREFAALSREMAAVLTTTQRYVMREILQHENVHVVGTAGTGKTLIALRVAQHYLKGGKKVLYVCFNQVIAEEVRLRAHHPDFAGLEVRTFHTLDELCFERNLKVFDGVGMDEGRTDCAFVNMMYDNGSKKRYDVILVDEGQDFTPTRLEFLLPLLVPEGAHFVLFSDAEQAIFQNADQLTDELLQGLRPGMVKMELDQNIRNTREIADFCQACIPDQQLAESVTDGVRVEEHQHTREGLEEWLREDLLASYSPSNVAILSDDAEFVNKLGLRVQGQAFYGKKPDAKGTFKNLDTWHKNKCGWKSTIDAFKGMEADVVILILFGRNIDRRKYQAVKYVGASRARYMLHVVTVIS